MSSLRPFQRQMRPSRLCLQSVTFRQKSTSSNKSKKNGKPANATSSRQSPPPPPPPAPRRINRSTIIWSSVALLLGLGAGSFAMHTFVPPTLPGAGTHQDSVLLEDLENRIDNEFTVKILRGKCLGVSKTLKGDHTGWVEIVPNGSSKTKSPGNGGTLISSLQGASNLGVERTFWSASEQKLVSVVWFGGDLSGWPGVTHGGLLATAITEKIALANALAHGTNAGVAKAVAPQRMPGSGNHATMPLPEDIPVEPSQLSIDYIKPTYAHNFHVIRVDPSWASPENVRIPIKDDEWIATLETVEKQKTCVRAAAKFAPRSQAERARETVVEGARWSYHEFKDWMWPSRQKQSSVQQGQKG